jgi:phosphatidylinositol alpha-1,6-mannosyltransferase
MINPVHLGEPDEREPLGDEFGFGDRPVVACISRLEPMKHPEDVVLAVAQAHARDPRVALVLVGEGAMREELERLCAEHGIADAVAFAGDRDQQWIARLLAQAAMVVAPLAGLSLVESALSGTPIVAYDYEWHAELIQSEQEGILVPYRDVDALAAAIGAVLADPARGARLGAALRARLVDVMQPDHLLAHERELAGGRLARSPA